MPPNTESSPLLASPSSRRRPAAAAPLESLFEKPTEDELSTRSSYRVAVKKHPLDKVDDERLYEDYISKRSTGIHNMITTKNLSTTITGSIVFAVYQTVFCLAMSSSILRPHARSSSSTTGALAKLAALGVIFSGPTFIYQLGSQV